MHNLLLTKTTNLPTHKICFAISHHILSVSFRTGNVDTHRDNWLKQSIYKWNLSIHGGRVVNAIACNARGDGFASHLRRYFRELNLESIQSPARRDLKMVCVALQKLTETCNVSGDNWQQITSFDRYTYSKYQTKQYSSTHTHTLPHCTHHRWWLVLVYGWPPSLTIRSSDSMRQNRRIMER